MPAATPVSGECRGSFIDGQHQRVLADAAPAEPYVLFSQGWQPFHCHAELALERALTPLRRQDRCPRKPMP